MSDPWDRQINADGDSLADEAVARLRGIEDRLDEMRRYFDVIAGCLVAMAPPDAGTHRKALDDARRYYGVMPEDASTQPELVP